MVELTNKRRDAVIRTALASALTQLQSDSLQEIAVWDWKHDIQKAALPNIRAVGFDAFIDKYRETRIIR